MHDTKSYYERGKSVLMHLNNIKFPRFMLKVFMLHFFCLLMQVDFSFNNLFVYKIPLHRKWVRLKCVCVFLLLNAIFRFNLYPSESFFKIITPILMAIKK